MTTTTEGSMTIWLNRTHFGDCRVTLRELAASGVKVQTCMTSPPYFGLRDYGHPGQIGLEQSPGEYVATMVDVFRAVRDVLADDGTVWLNIGDSYAGDGGSHSPRRSGNAFDNPAAGGQPRPGPSGLKAKDLIGIPWMLAFALRDDGWYLRQDIIWHKPNPMPESVRDRCTKAHEYIFLLSKSERYYFDSDAMKEPVSGTAHSRGNGVGPKAAANSFGNKQNASFSAAVAGLVESRNRRSVWTVATHPYRGAHFATFPPSLVEPCILAGSRAGDVVLDPFMGSGTTAEVAQRLGRAWVGCEINEAYAPLQHERTRQPGLELEA